MKQPYIMQFDSLPNTISQQLPDWCTYPFSMAQKKSYLQFKSGKLLTQHLKFKPFHIELFELKCDDLFGMSYEVFEKQHFLFFMLEGSTTFSTQEGLHVSYAKSGHFAFVSNEKGRFKLALPAGHYSALCLALEYDWLEFFSEDQPVLKGFLDMTSPGGHDMLPYCRIDRKVASWLKRLYSELQAGRGSLDGQLRFYISLILERYNHLAKTRLSSLPWKAKEYLDKMFKNPELSLKSISDHLEVNSNHLRDQFKAEFMVTPHHYYTCRRLYLAHQLMVNYNLPLRQVFSKVGYNDESALRYEMKQFGLSTVNTHKPI